MKCENCGIDIEDNNIKICPSCGKRVKRDKFPVWVFVLVLIFLFASTFIPLEIVAFMTFPVLFSSNNSMHSKLLFKKTVSTLNQALTLSAAINGSNYHDFDNVWEKSLKKYLNINSENNNIVQLSDKSEIKYKILDDNCSDAPTVIGDINEKTACAIIIIDTDGFEKGINKLCTKEKINDQFKLLLYADKVVPIPKSAEEELLKPVESDR